MKLVRCGRIGHERPALVGSDGRLRDLGSIVPDIDNVSLASPAWQKLGSIENLSALPDLGPVDGVRLGPCITGVGKVICMGLNERTHSNEIKAGSAAKPIIFLKATSSISGAQDPVVYPKIGQ